MNAPTTKAAADAISVATLAHYTALAAEARARQILPGLIVLAIAYEHDGQLYDLHGTEIEDGIEVEDVSLTGDHRTVGNLFSRNQLYEMSDWCERQAKRRAANDATDNGIDAMYLAMRK